MLPKNTAKITGNFHVAGGIAQSRDVKFDSNLGNGVASGNINLPEWSINLDGKLKLGQSFIRDLLKSNNQEKNLTIPFAITGNLDAPSVKMDANTFFRTGIPILGVDKILNRAPKEVEGLLKDILEKGENTLRSDGNAMQELPPAVSSEVP